jgi:hypothetical protein
VSDTPRTDEAHRVAMSLVVGDDYSAAHDEMLLHARKLERELNAALICAGVASKERGEWEAERQALLNGSPCLPVFLATVERAAKICESRAGSQATAAFRILMSAADAIRQLSKD